MQTLRSIVGFSLIFFRTHILGVQVDSSRNTQRNLGPYASDIPCIIDETDKELYLVLIVIALKMSFENVRKTKCEPCVPQRTHVHIPSSVSPRSLDTPGDP